MFILTINTDNAAFDGENKVEEVIRILQETSRRLAEGLNDGALLDSNGNKVGSYELSCEAVQ